MLAASSKGTVPVLVLPDGRVIEESLDIMRWALATCDPEDWLARDDAVLIAVNDGSFKQDLDAYKYPERNAGDRLMHRASGATFLAAINARLSKGGQLCGSERGFADAAIMPFVRQFAAVDQEWFDTLPLSDLRTWLKGHLQSDLFNATMMRIAPWSPGDRPAFFPPTKPPDVAQ
jgi:glutathione S-transferase